MDNITSPRKRIGGETQVVAATGLENYNPINIGNLEHFEMNKYFIQ